MVPEQVSPSAVNDLGTAGQLKPDEKRRLARPPARPHPSPVQDRWLRERVGKVLRVRLVDGKTLSGTLRAFDTYALLLERSDEDTLLLYKQGIAYLAAGEGEPSGQRPPRRPATETRPSSV